MAHSGPTSLRVLSGLRGDSSGFFYHEDSVFKIKLKSGFSTTEGTEYTEYFLIESSVAASAL